MIAQQQQATDRFKWVAEEWERVRHNSVEARSFWWTGHVVRLGEYGKRLIDPIPDEMHIIVLPENDPDVTLFNIRNATGTEMVVLATLDDGWVRIRVYRPVDAPRTTNSRDSDAIGPS